jgi:hypothetical protein
LAAALRERWPLGANFCFSLVLSAPPVLSQRAAHFMEEPAAIKRRCAPVMYRRTFEPRQDKFLIKPEAQFEIRRSRQYGAVISAQPAGRSS